MGIDKKTGDEGVVSPLREIPLTPLAKSPLTHNEVSAPYWSLLEEVNLQALDSEWLAKQPEDKRPTLLLRAYRERRGLTQKEIAYDSGTLSTNISLWENGDSIPHKWLAPLIQELSLSTREADDFLALLRKLELRQIGSLLKTHRSRDNLTRNELAERLGLADQKLINIYESGRGTISLNNLEKLKQELSFSTEEAKHFTSLVIKSRIPLMDTSWLTVQKESKHPGKYLEAYLKRNDLSQGEAGQALGVTSGTVSTWVRSGKIPAEYAKPLSQLLHLTKKETDQFTLLIIPALDPAWLSEQGKDKQTGLLLEALRRHKSFSRKELGNAVGVNEATIGRWEAGAEIPYLQLAPLMRGLSLNEEEKAHFMSAAIPPLDAKWLSEQERTKRPGLLVENHRKRKGLTQKDLAGDLQADVHTITRWESGEPVALSYAERLTRSLEMNVNDAAQFIRTVHAAELPALDPEWLKDQEESKPAGLLLEAFRKRKGLTQEELAHEVGLTSPAPISKWELGHTAIPHARFDELPHALDLSAEETEYFTRLRFPEKEAKVQMQNKLQKPLSFAERAVPKSILPGSADLQRMGRVPSK